jgi:DNA-binding IclR family transcriptional regulator
MPPESCETSMLSKTAAKALAVLECLALADSPLTAQAVGEGCGISRPTAYRLLRTLMECGFVETVGDGQYRLGTKILRLSRHVLDRLEVPSLAKPILRRLREQTGEMSLAAILEKDGLFYIAKYETTHAVRMDSRVGTSGHLHSTALGKAILAFLSADEQTTLLQNLPLPRVTPKTITSQARLRTHLAEVRRQGFAIEDEENEPEIRSIAAPVFNHMGEVVGAVGTSGPAYRLDLGRLNRIAVFVVEAAEAVSAALGFVRTEQGRSRSGTYGSGVTGRTGRSKGRAE